VSGIHVHPVAETYARVAALHDGTADAAHDAEIHKYCNGDGRAADAPIPVATETFGHVGTPATQLLTRLTGMKAESGKLEQNQFVLRTA
jgi:hypothetical protein